MPATKKEAQASIDVLRANSLARIPWLVHGFSTRIGGVSKMYGGRALNLGFTVQDSRSLVEKNRHAFLSAVVDENFRAGKVNRSIPGSSGRSGAGKADAFRLITLRQIHSDIIHHVSKPAGQVLAGDGLISNTPGVLLGVLTADCLPVILVDTKRKAVGVFHAGWRGTTKRIVEKGVGEMHRWFGTNPRDLRAAIGPGIRGCCYQVGPEVQEIFHSQFEYAGELFRETKERDEIHEKYPLLFLTARAPGHSELPKKIFLDLAEANRRQLLAAGVPVGNISELSMCTACHVDRFFSHRAEKGVTGRMMAVVGIANG